MVIDAHCHIYPDKIADKAAHATARFYTLPATYDGTLSTLSPSDTGYVEIGAVFPDHFPDRAHLYIPAAAVRDPEPGRVKHHEFL